MPLSACEHDARLGTSQIISNDFAICTPTRMNTVDFHHRGLSQRTQVVSRVCELQEALAQVDKNLRPKSFFVREMILCCESGFASDAVVKTTG
jgi:hypothetical protein